ncbi:MAG: serine hydrolase domain-containing protein [Myxococcota bacterium]
MPLHRLRRACLLLGLAALILFGSGCRAPRDLPLGPVRTEAGANARAVALAEAIRAILPSDRGAAAIAIDEGDAVRVAFAGDPAISRGTLFEFGSITKVATANLVAQRVLAGALDLDRPLVALPGGEPLGDAWSATTLRQLLTHSSGLSGWPPDLGPVRITLSGRLGDPFADYDGDDLLRGMQRQRRPTPDGDFVYSNYAFAILGRVLEAESGGAYDALLAQRFLRPVGTRTMTLRGWSSGDVAPPLSRRGRPTTNWAFEAFAPAGALRGSLDDGIALLRHAMTACARDEPVARATCRTQHSEGFWMNETSEMGLAWVRTTRDDDVVVWHNGGTGGYSTFLGFAEKARRGVVVLTNVGFLREIDGLAMDAIAARDTDL